MDYCVMSRGVQGASVRTVCTCTSNGKACHQAGTMLQYLVRYGMA
jgi:hypothetical protein